MSVTPQDVAAAVERLGSINKAALELGISRDTAQRRYKAAQAGFEVQPLPSADIPLDELKRRRFEDFDRLRAAKDQRKLIRIKLPSNDPVGLALFGDPHLDDDGCDLRRLYDHADLVRETPGLYGVSVGDHQNLWVGRLMRLYADQTTKAADGWRLTEDFLKTVRDWLALVWGNHCHWAGPGDPLKALAKAHVPVAEPYNVRLALEFPNGREVRMWMRHDFAGATQWNNMHGMVKAAKMGAPFHLFVAGHTHCSGHHAEYDYERDAFWHTLRVAGYKTFDAHAEMLGFPPDAVMQCPVAIIDPEAESPAGLIKVEYEPADGADRLTWMRSRRG